MEKWVVSAKKADFQEIAEKFQIDKVTARLIRNRDIIGDEAIEEYLNGGWLHLHSPHQMKDCDRAVAILQVKIKEQKKIRIIGDYDIDGVNASYILYQGLLRAGAVVDVEIPDRMKDGYGINEKLIQEAADEGVNTIITCDNGIAAVEQIAYARKLGMTVIITDHHELQEVVPLAEAIVNPRQPDCPYPFKSLCGAAVAYKLVTCLYEAMGVPAAEAEAFIEFAAIATVGDVMDLVGENRIMVKEGLRLLTNTSNLGLKALKEVNGLADSEISAYHIGFVLGPCINASGRLDTAKKVLELLLSQSEEQAMELAVSLKALNDERKAMTLEGVAKAITIIETSNLSADKVLVVYLPECHESLAGIIAGRLRECYHKPAFVLTDAEQGVKGSGRSIEAYPMFTELCKCSHLFTKYGGHAMAAGLSLPKDKVAVFREMINREAELTEADFIPKIIIDVPMPVDYITESLIEELKILEPFGMGNPKPVFAEKNLNIVSARILGKNKNVIKMQVSNERKMRMEAIYFGDVEVFKDYINHKFGESEVEKLFQSRENKVVLSATYYPTINEYREMKTLQIVIQNYQ